MGRKNNRQVAHTPDEIKELLTPLRNELQDAWARSLIEGAENQIQMLQDEENPVRKQCMRSQSKRRKKIPEAPHVAKLHRGLIKGTSGKKEDVELAIKAILEFDKKYRPDTHHDLTIKRTVKNLLGVEKLSHKFTFTAEDKKALAKAFEVIAQDLVTLYPEIVENGDDNQAHGYDKSSKEYKHIPQRLHGDHLIDRYTAK